MVPALTTLTSKKRPCDSNLEEKLQKILVEGSAAAREWKGLSTLAFDITSLDEEDLIPMTLRLIVMHDLAAKFSITANTWAEFMTSVKELMHPNPYHNFQHICAVSQTTSAIIGDNNLSGKLSDLEKFTLIISALLHDLGHPGKNNAYQVNAGTELAVIYNDISVLENHHCATSSRLMVESGILNGVQAELKKQVRTNFIDVVLATDMTKHFDINGELSKFNESPERQASLSATDRQLIMKSVLHMADISNPAKEWSLCKLWSDRISAECFEQGDAEKREGLPVSPMCCRNTTFQDEISFGFFDFIVAPYLFNVACLAPCTLIPACRVLAINRDIWHNMLAARIGNDDEKMKPWTTKRDTFVDKIEALLAKFPAY